MIDSVGSIYPYPFNTHRVSIISRRFINSEDDKLGGVLDYIG